MSKKEVRDLINAKVDSMEDGIGIFCLPRFWPIMNKSFKSIKTRAAYLFKVLIEIPKM